MAIKIDFHLLTFSIMSDYIAKMVVEVPRNSKIITSNTSYFASSISSKSPCKQTNMTQFMPQKNFTTSSGKTFIEAYLRSKNIVFPYLPVIKDGDLSFEEKAYPLGDRQEKFTHGRDNHQFIR